MGGNKKKESTKKPSTKTNTTKKKTDTYVPGNNKETYNCMSYTYTHYATGNGSNSSIGSYFNSKKDI